MCWSFRPLIEWSWNSVPVPTVSRSRQVVRAKIVLLAADGEPNTRIAERLDVDVGVVSRWRKRFFESGLDG